MRGRPYINLVGQKYSRLLVVEKTEKRATGGNIIYRCLCDCGNYTFVSSCNLRSKSTSSCGCLFGSNALKHGHRRSHTGEYKTWEAMKTRCTNTKFKQFKDYGGRGIKVCEEWLHSFENFLDYLIETKMYPKPDGLSIDRINNDGNYEPGNIRWATPSQQKYNQRKRT